MDIKLSNGKTVKIDLQRIKTKEFLTLFKDNLSEEDKQVIIAKAAGLTPEEWDELPQPDTQKRIIPAFWKMVREPLADPNSESASSSA